MILRVIIILMFYWAALGRGISDLSTTSVFTYDPASKEFGFSIINYVTAKGITFTSANPVTVLSNTSIQRVIGSIILNDSGHMKNISMPALLSVTGNVDGATTANFVTNVYFPNLLAVNGSMIIFDATAIHTWDTHSLQYVGADFQGSQIGDVAVLDFGQLTNVVGPFSIGETVALKSLNLSNLVTCPFIQFGDHPNLTNINLASYIGGASQGNNQTMNDVTLTNFTLPSLKLWSGNVKCDNCAFSAASVNQLLHVFVTVTNETGALWGPGGWAMNLSGGTSAAPTGQGITDKNTLVARGAAITTN